jgi:hypothetical protein
MRLVELAFKCGGQQYRVGLTGPHHCIVAPSELPLRALRDGVCAAFYGAEHFPGGARGGLRGASVAFEVNTIRYRIVVDLSNGRRALLREGSGAPELVADQAGTVSQSLTALLYLPSAIVYRSLTLSTVDFPVARLPRIPAGVHRALLAHAQAPDPLRQEVDAAVQRVDLARQRARRPVLAAPWRDPVVLAGAGAGAVALGLAAFAPGAARMAGLGGPLLFGIGAWRSLRWVDAVEARTQGLKGLDEAEAAARARKRHLEDLEGHLDAIERFAGNRLPETVASTLAAAGEGAPDPEVQDHVDVYAGDSPDPQLVKAFQGDFGAPGNAAATAGLVLAAMKARGGRSAPLFWIAEGGGAGGVAWDKVFDRSGPLVHLFLFTHEPASSAARAAVLRAVGGAEAMP